MILIADSGATKTHWVLLNKGIVELEIYSKGFNPYYYKASEFTESLLNEFKGKISYHDISAVYFYAAGCSSEANAEKISLTSNFPMPQSERITTSTVLHWRCWGMEKA